MKQGARGRFLRITGGLVGFLVVLGIVIGINAILRNIPLRQDMTEERLYTLSRGTRNVLKKLDRTVTLKLFFSSSSGEVAAAVRNFSFLKNYVGRIEDLLREYEIASGGRILVEKYDPKPDSEAEDWAQRYGVEGQQLGMDGMAPKLYIGLAADAGGANAVMPVLDPRTEDMLEYNITRMILRVSNPKKPVVAVLSSLPVMGMAAMPFQMPGQPQGGRPPWFVFKNLQEDYEVRRLDASVSEIDKDVDVLLLVHPSNLGDDTLYAIDQFVLRGGRLAAFIDPMCVVEKEVSMVPQQPFSPADSSAGLSRLFGSWGVSVESGKVVADLANALQGNPVLVGLRQAGAGGRGESSLSHDDPLTSRLEVMVMAAAGGFAVGPTKDLKVTTLVSSSDSSGLVGGMMAQFGSEAVRKELKNEHRRFPLAVRLQGKFKTAFPDGRPAAKPDGDKTDGDKEKDKAKDAPAAGPGLRESAAEGTLILVGDVDMLYDRFCVQEVNFLGFTGYQPLNDNMNFFANLVDQMAGGSDLVAIRSRSKIIRPFEKVRELEARAEDQWLEQERMLQARLQETEQRLKDLQQTKDKSQTLIMTPEQKKAVEKFREDMARTRKELKNVRRKLREDIESLGMWVKLANVLLMPGLVIAAGVGYGLYRRSRMTR